MQGFWIFVSLMAVGIAFLAFSLWSALDKNRYFSNPPSLGYVAGMFSIIMLSKAHVYNTMDRQILWFEAVGAAAGTIIYFVARKIVWKKTEKQGD